MSKNMPVLFNGTAYTQAHVNAHLDTVWRHCTH